MSYCDAYEPCQELDGRILITRTMDGPPLAITEDLGLGDFQLAGASLRPYVRLGFQQEWIPREPCYGPVRSILGLAPGEEIVTEVRTAETRAFSSLVQTAMESSEVTTNTRLEGREFIDQDWDGETIDLSKITVGEWGSFWEVAGAVVGGALGGPIGAGIGAWVGGAIDDATGDGGGGAPPADSATGKIVSVVEESLETVQKSESRQLVTERSRSVTRTQERSITRTFRNPYIDRTLELRFIPAFRHFEVVTTIWRFEWGVSLDVGRVRFPRFGVGQTHGDFLAKRLTDQRMLSVANAELGVDDEFATSARNGSVGNHLNANAEVYSKKLLRHMHASRDLETLQQPVMQALRSKVKKPEEAVEIGKAFQWGSTYTSDKSIYVPATTPELALPKLGLDGKTGATFRGKLERIALPKLRRVVSRKHVHLFAGTHIEAVPGLCRLPDLPVMQPCCPPGDDEDDG